MTNKQKRILVDILLLIFVVLSFVRWEGTNGFIFHATVGSVFVVLVMAHLWLNRNWIFSAYKAVKEKRANKKMRQMFFVNLCLVVTMDVVIISGFLAIPSFIYDIESFYIFSRIHAISSRICAILMIVHVFQHLEHIRAYMGLNKRSKPVDKLESDEM